MASTASFLLSNLSMPLLSPPPPTLLHCFTRCCSSGPDGSRVEFDFKQYMRDKLIAINRAIDNAIPLAKPQRLHEAMRHSILSNGKRIRPVLCIAACNIAGGTDDMAMPAAVAMEMIHTMSLIQDDLPCMDNDDLRRDRPTCHRAFDEPTALHAVVALHALAFEYLADPASYPIAVSADRIVRAVIELARCSGSKGIMAGQAVDMESTGHGTTPASLEHLEYIHLHKTSIAFEASAVIGTCLGGGTSDQVERMRQYARCLGLLFQVVDDIMDVTKSTEELGKTAGKDLASGKTTYPKLLGLEKSREVVATLLEDAKDQLVVFDSVKAAPLLHLADYVVHRIN